METDAKVRLCRACLTANDSGEPMVDLNESSDGTSTASSSELTELYKQCTSLPLNQFDRITKYLCQICFAKLMSYSEFRQQCIQSYQHLTSLLSDEKLSDATYKIEHALIEEPAAAIADEALPPMCLEELEYLEEDVAEDAVTDDDYYLGSGCEEVYLDYCDEKDDAKLPHAQLSIVQVADESPTDRFVCDLCQKSFARKHRLKLHMRCHMHADVQADESAEYKCEHEGCDKTYTIKNSLSVHVKKKHGTRDNPGPMKTTFICEHCGKSFNSNFALTKHVYTHLPNLMPFRCHLCPKKYPTKHKLKEHMMRHEGVKNYVCPLCGLRKITGHELKVHMNYHTKTKQFPCDLCPRIFSNVGNRSRHIKIVHCGIKEYKCTHCERSFGKSETLKHHIMTHTGEKPLSCHICDKRFIQPIALKTHLKTHAKPKR